jgi:hypothetical protein
MSSQDPGRERDLPEAEQAEYERMATWWGAEAADETLTAQRAWEAEQELHAERVDQENRGIPWAKGPDRTYAQMERDDAEHARRYARIQAEAEAEAEADATPF